jgi:hypothetical protein
VAFGSAGALASLHVKRSQWIFNFPVSFIQSAEIKFICRVCRRVKKMKKAA